MESELQESMSAVSMTAVSMAELGEPGAPALEVEVVERRLEAPEIVSLRLRALGQELPDWHPGSHIDVATPFGLRQYSLCGERVASGGEWMIAVRKETEGAGGSRWLHEHATPSAVLRVGMPRDLFGFRAASEVLLIAGGIGITPILPMAEDLAARGASWRLLYTAGGVNGHAFAGRLRRLGEAVLWSSRDHGRLSVRDELERLGPHSTVYCCGPEGLIAEVREVASELGIGECVRTELFTAEAEAMRESDAEFTVTLQRSGQDITVPVGKTLLECLGEAGTFVVSSCRAGICGSCETAVVAGRIDHRDRVLSERERAANDCIFPCVSRALPGQHLVLDL